MRDLPKKVLIFGRWYKVSIEEIPGDIAGDCDPTKELIRIAPGQKMKDRTHSFFHEMFHGVIFRTGVFQGVDEKIIEIIVDSMATALLENFKVRKKHK